MRPANNQPMVYMPEVVTGDAKRHGVAILPVDVNKSLWNAPSKTGRYGRDSGM